MEGLEGLSGRLAGNKPAGWDQMPDIQIYMDQLVSYLSRQLPDWEKGGALTPAMVNNYIKAGLMPRAEEKRYNKEHIALLTAICVIKHVLTTKEIGQLFVLYMEDRSSRELYFELCRAMEKEMEAAASPMSGEPDRAQLASLALELAVSAYCRQLACRKILDLLGPGEKDENHKNRPKNKSKMKDKDAEGNP